MRVYDGAQWIPASASQEAALITYEYVATAGQTTFSGNDVNAVSLSYIAGGLIVSLNGVVLRPGDDYTATNGTSIVLITAAAAGDILQAHSFASFVVANTYTQAQIDAGFLTKNNPSYTGTLTGGTGVVNLGSGQFYKDASGNVGIGTSSPVSLLDVQIAAATNGGATFGVNGTMNGTIGTGGFSVNGGALTDFGIRAANNMLFSTGSGAPERMRIDSSGNLLVGKTADTNSVAGTVIGMVDAGGAGKHGKVKITNTIGTGQNVLELYNASGSSVGAIQTTSSGTSYVTTSDYRLKENIQPMSGALAKVVALKPCTYTWKADGSAGQGFIAHELQAVVSDCVTGTKDAVDAEGNPVYQGIDTSFLVATLTAAIQEQQALIASQSEIINAQQAALESLTARIEALENQT